MRAFRRTLTLAWSAWLLTIVAAFTLPKEIAMICGPVVLKLYTIVLLLATALYLTTSRYKMGMKR